MQGEGSAGQGGRAALAGSRKRNRDGSLQSEGLQTEDSQANIPRSGAQCPYARHATESL
jgi:hypothetical protein